MASKVNYINSSQKKDFPYFKKLWLNVVIVLLVVSFVPLILLGGGMYFYSTSVLKEKTLESLFMEVKRQKDIIDQFLEERTRDLQLIANNIKRADLVDEKYLASVFASLHKQLPCFVDLGVIDEAGRHLAYVGPYDLISKNYKHAFWFKQVMQSGIYISDIFAGFRQSPHFIIAVKNKDQQGDWILRATIDTVFFNDVISHMVKNKNGEAFLINSDGVLQTDSKTAGRIMDKSGIQVESFDGVKYKDQDDLIRSMIWLEKVPWVCVVQVDRNEVFKALTKLRIIGVYVFVIGAILIELTVLITINHLIGRLEKKRRVISQLDAQLERSNKASLFYSSSKDALIELKDALNNIDAVMHWIEELPKTDQAFFEVEVNSGLAQVRTQTERGRRIVSHILKIDDISGPGVGDVDINWMLDMILTAFKPEMGLRQIQSNCQYQPDCPSIRTDAHKMHSILHSLIQNIIQDIDNQGTLSIKTATNTGNVEITLTGKRPLAKPKLDPLGKPGLESNGKYMDWPLDLSRNIDRIKKIGGTITAKFPSRHQVKIVVNIPIQFFVSN